MGFSMSSKRQVAVERQAVPGRRAGLGEGDVGLFGIDVAHAPVVTEEGAHQPLLRALAAQVFEQRQQRTLAVVERDVVEIVEDPRLGEFAQLGIDEAAAEHGDDGAVVGLDRLGDAEGAIDIAGKGRRHQHHIGRVSPHGVQRQLAQRAVDQVLRRGQCLRQRIE
jgi:hypothetical protein